LVIDNSSGTYAPASEHLPRVRDLFLSNFPGMEVEALPVGDPRLRAYQERCCAGKA
jgi:hypothetical protein